MLRVNSNGVLVIENPHENPKYILSARLGFLDPSEVCLVPRSNRLDTPAFIDVVSRNFPDRLQELLQNPSGVDRVQKPIVQTTKNTPGVEIEQVQEPIRETVEASPGVDFDQRQEPIEPVAETSPAVSVEQVQEPIEFNPIHSQQTQKAQEHKFFLCLKDGDNTLWYDGKDFVVEKWSAKTYCKRGVGAAKHQLRAHPEVKRVFCSLGNVLQVVENSPRIEPIEVQAQEAIEVQAQEAAEASPGVDFDQRQEPIDLVAETSPAVSVEQVQEAIEVQAQEPPLESKFGRIVYPQPAQKKSIAQNEEARPQLDGAESADVHNRRSHPTESGRDSSSVKTETLGSQEGDRVLAVAGNHQTDRGRVLPHQPTELTAALFTEADCPQKRGDDDHDRLENKPRMSQSAIVPEAKNLPVSRSKASTAHQLLKLFQSSVHIIEDSPGVKTEATVSESAIASAANISLPDQNPILTGLTFSPGFLARYSPPQPENINYKADTDGQLSLLDFEISSDEPPDPDDFESLDAFCEAIALWDREHPSSFDYCSDYLPSSVQNELPLQVPLDSFCLWAHCPDEWYESAVLLEPSKVLEVSPFFIPTFDRWGDRSNRSDEPPDTGIFACLPKPKPPTFPPQAASQSQLNRKSATS